MTRRHNHPQRGFTLVELLIATGLTITVIGAAVLVFTQSVQTSNLTLKRSEVQTEARAARTGIAGHSSD